MIRFSYSIPNTLFEFHPDLRDMNRKKALKKSALTKTIEEYASRSTIHGIGYLFDRGLGIVDRLLWLFVVVAFLSIASALTWNFWSQWRNEQVKHLTFRKMIQPSQVVTILNNTTKLVEDVPFPALTLCGSGIHMSNVEKKLVQDIIEWRAEKKKDNTTKEALNEDLKEFMKERFQIEQVKTNGVINILDILDMMISPDPDASVAVNSVRENVVACKQQKEQIAYNQMCVYSCPDQFHVSGTQCFYLSDTSEGYAVGRSTCQSLGAQLATIRSEEEDNFVSSLVGSSEDVRIGLIRTNWTTGNWAWLDTSEPSPYRNWLGETPDETKSCIIKSNQNLGKWKMVGCESTPIRFVCSRAATESCDSSKTLTQLLRRRTCIEFENNNNLQDEALNFPDIDIFLNPAKVEEKKTIIREKKAIAENYFRNSDMKTLYPELFRILWQSTLPCFKEESKEKQMMLSCELAGVKVNCSDYFTRVPTDMGMCCALNVKDSLRTSEYRDLVKELQRNKAMQKVKSQEGRRNGLKLTLDLHSNTVSLGTLDQQQNAFKMFIGEPAQFPMMRDKSVNLEPGREHFVDLSATVVTTKEIRKISPEARGCFFTDEGDLEFYSSYTLSNCRLECQIKQAEKKYNCIPWFLPRVGFETRQI